MALVVSGLLNKQVAGEPGISEITAKAHRGHREAEDDGRLSRRPMTMDVRLQLAPATSFATDTIVQ